MTHHHDHHHDHDHHHHHDHDHEHEHDIKSHLSDQEKLIKLLDHWIAHNQSHLETYEKWAQTAQSQGLAAVAELLAEAGKMTLAINDRFNKALAQLK